MKRKLLDDVVSTTWPQIERRKMARPRAHKVYKDIPEIGDAFTRVSIAVLVSMLIIIASWWFD